MKRKNEAILKFKYTRKIALAVLVFAAGLFLVNMVSVDMLQDMFAPDNSDTILFSQRNGLDYELISISPDGTNLQTLTDNDWDEWGASWSPDRSQIAYRATTQYGSRIFVMDADGSNNRAVTPTDMYVGDILRTNSISWSPDGTLLLFDALYRGNSDIFTVNVETGEITEIVSHPGHDMSPMFSPDGQYIVFNSFPGNDYQYSQIFITPADGSYIRRLTSAPWGLFFPSWSPDGTQIVFQGIYGENSDIFIMNADGSNVRRVTETPSIDRVPKFSPDGSQLIFRSERFGNSELVILTLATGDIQRLTDNEFTDMSPDW